MDKPAGGGRVRSVCEIIRFAKEWSVTVIHGHCPVPMLLGKLAGKMLGIPVFCTVHNSKKYFRRWEQLTAWMVSKYVAIGGTVEHYMTEELAIPSSKIERIYNAIDVKKFEGVRPSSHFWENYGGQDGQTSILNVARVHESKNQMCLLEALKRCVKAGRRDIRLYILGQYRESDQIYQDLQTYIEKNCLCEYVCFLGMHNNVPDFLANADVFVLPSFYEGLSVAFLEAVIVGLPIVATEMGFVTELCEIAPCATVIPQGDSQELAQVLLEKRYARQSAETIAAFRERFSMDGFVEKHEKLYQSVAK